MILSTNVFEMLNRLLDN